MPYIQQGGGIFSSLADMAKRYAMPFFVSAAKTAKSGAVRAIKSDTTKNLVNQAKKAVEDGLYDASGRILEGENVGEAIKQTSSLTKQKIENHVKQEAQKLGNIPRIGLLA